VAALIAELAAADLASGRKVGPTVEAVPPDVEVRLDFEPA
jgi:hypothetical protein